MRSAERISRTVREWRDHEQAERERMLREVLAELREARERGEEWVAWIDAGCPRLTPQEYEARTGRRASGGRREQLRTSPETVPPSRNGTRHGRRRPAEPEPTQAPSLW